MHRFGRERNLLRYRFTIKTEPVYLTNAVQHRRAYLMATPSADLLTAAEAGDVDAGAGVPQHVAAAEEGRVGVGVPRVRGFIHFALRRRGRSGKVTAGARSKSQKEGLAAPGLDTLPG